MNSEDKQPNSIITAHGGFRKLFSYQKAEIIYDGTVYFTNRFFNKYDRTVDQMVQAARSGKQNIAEASMSSATSRLSEMKLTNVAKASLVELEIDYFDFLRNHQLPAWSKEHRLVKRLRELNLSLPNPTYETFKKAIEHNEPEICANTMITLIRICTYLLDRQINSQAKVLIEQGDLSTRIRKVKRSK